MEYAGENTIPTESPESDADHIIPLRNRPSKKGPILLKRRSQFSEINLCVEEETCNQSRVYQNQSGLGPVSSTEKIGSDDEERKTEEYVNQLYPADYPEYDDTIESFDRSPLPVTSHSLALMQEIHLLLPELKTEATKIEVPQTRVGMTSHMSVTVGGYSPSNTLHKPSLNMPAHNMYVPIPDMKMSHRYVDESSLRLTMLQQNMDYDLPSTGMTQSSTGEPVHHASTTSSMPASPPHQLQLIDSMDSSRPPISHPHQEDFSALNMPRNITGQTLFEIGTGQMKKDVVDEASTGKLQSYSNTESLVEVKHETDGYESLIAEQGLKMRKIEDSDMQDYRSTYHIYSNLTKDTLQYKNDYVENNEHADRKNLQESPPNSYDSRLAAKGGFKSDKGFSPDAKADSTESDLNISSHKTGAERNFSSDSECYARISEIDLSDYLIPVHMRTRHDLKPLKPRPINSTAFPLPPTPGVENMPFNEADVDIRVMAGQTCGIEEVFSKLTHKTEDAASKLKLPDPVELKDLNPQILKFLIKNKKHKQLFEKNLSDIYAVAIWPSSLEDCVIIKCTVKVEDKNASLLLKDWSIKIVDKVKNFTAGIEVAKFYMILLAWPKVLKELRASRVENPEDVMVFFEQDQYSIVLTGSRGTMEALKKRVLDIIDMVIAQIMHEEQRITETKPMQTCAIILLMESNFKQEIKKLYPGLQFDLNLKEKNAIFVGQPDIVQKAVVQMHEKLQSFVSINMPISKAVKDLLLVKEINNYIKQKMKSQKIIGVWDVAVKDEIQMFAQDERDVQKAIQIVSNCLVEKEIILDDVMAQNVKGQPWLQLVEKIQEKHKQKVAIETSMKSILIVARDDIFLNVFNEINGYLEKHVKELVLELGLVKIKYIKRYKMEDIKALEKKFDSLHVKLFIIDYGDQQGIKIKGTMHGCKALETALTEMAKNVITKEHEMVSKAGLKELFQCSRGRDELSLIEGRWKCLIEMKDSSTSVNLQLEGASEGCSSGREDDDDECNEPTDWQLSSDICVTSIDACGIKVSFLEGELAKQRVDVIVNSTNQKLDLSIGAVSNNILNYGGDTIQKECLKQYPNGIDPGKVVVTSGGNLSCKNIYHGYLKAYDHGKGKSLKLLRTFVKNCLKEADKSGFQSMAFPSIGTGKLGFPADKVGKLLVQCIEKFGKKTPKTSLKEIALVVFPSDTKNIKAFTDLFSGSTVSSTSKIATQSTDVSMDHGIYKCTFHDSVVLEMIQGDITKEMTDVIVNSVLPGLSLNQGNVSKAILKAGGISIEQECLQKVPDLEKDGFVVTKAGNLPCKMIIHMAAQNKRKAWEDIIMPVLRHADRLQFNSISFPALGTGGKGLSPKKIAKAIYSACTDFAKSQPVCLKKIRVVLFKTKMLTAFVQTIGYCRSSQEETRWLNVIFSTKNKLYMVASIAGGRRTRVNPWKDDWTTKAAEKLSHMPSLAELETRTHADRVSEHPVDRTSVMEKSDPISLMFSITTDSESNFKAAVEDLEGFVKNELTEKEICSPREIIAKLVDKQVTEVKGMGHGQAMVSIKRKKGVIKVSGTQREVLDTYENIMKYLRNIEREQLPVPKVLGQEGILATTKESSGK